MARLTEEDKARNEAAIRAAVERVLSGHLPVGGKADLKTLAALAGVTRTGFYPKKNRDGTARPGAYQHLAEEFKILAISRLAAQHDEIERLRKQAANGENVRRLPVSRNGTAP
ncbi:hypothetical protein [Streptomyces goshikiensis]|uniref:hypothetical protein n=1 Tax=Streptomyces goshikiensis TaxID=1942 RepID=UPI003646B9EC